MKLCAMHSTLRLVVSDRLDAKYGDQKVNSGDLWFLQSSLAAFTSVDSSLIDMAAGIS